MNILKQWQELTPPKQINDEKKKPERKLLMAVLLPKQVSSLSNLIRTPPP